MRRSLLALISAAALLPVRRCGHMKLCVCAAKVWTYSAWIKPDRPESCPIVLRNNERRIAICHQKNPKTRSARASSSLICRS